ncbi:hypothetical protein GCK72_012700 [Caenorhabditis remanei]|uniref:Uncharacterized protein n=1 Tax=Caenorhabditis remanei TaxID=31234 RepID=A0A6A5GLV0_CAERE|nr:hypothetical protein GCK72_012700 [Caenorhabditis remanei]KAF1756247.1 hypothetical protein GCK72_012700 [Caenorhabditis remanei]
MNQSSSNNQGFDGSGKPYVLPSIPNSLMMTPLPSPVATTHSDNQQTYKDLVASIDKSVLNIYEAGLAIHNGYARGDSTIQHQVTKFVEKYASRISGSLMPPPSPVMDPHYLFIMTHGYGCLTQLSFQNSVHSRNKAEKESMELGELTGAVCNLDENTQFFYPIESPFSGKRIDLRVEMPRKTNVPAHVLIKRLIFTILSRSCTIPTDIQDVTWSVPEDSTSLRTLNPTPFPRSLYDDIQSLLLQYFRLDEDLLSRGSYDNETCKDMRCLLGITDPSARKSRYMTLHRAKITFMTTTYHVQFKSALTDLKRATYIPPSMGQQHGVFKLESHAAKRRRNDGEDD